MPKERLLQCQQEDRAKGLTEHHIQQLKVYFTQYIYDLANSVKLRQRVAATAVVYFRRLYAGSSFSAYDPHLVAPGCLYLASKVEESVIAAKVLLPTMKRLRPAWQYELKDLLDMEMVILEQLDTHLVVFSPYLSLTKVLESDAQLADLGQNAWAALNDVYRTDAPIIYPPHILVLGCLYLASVICSRDITAWLETVNMDTNQVSTLIIGAGPTGLGAATRLQQHGKSDWLLVDQAAEAGGLARTAVTPQGFLFDMGGHVIFSHWEFFDQLLDAAVGSDGWNTLQRVSYVHIKNKWVAYPFQNNIAALDKDDQVACLIGLVDAKVATATAAGKPATFDEWILRVMGKGIADMFMRPYNLKVWGVPTTDMQCEWLGERVATVDVSRAITNIIRKQEDAGWGPNAVFRFPKHGGTGAIWKGVARLLPASKQRYGAAVSAIDQEAKQVTLSNGEVIQYQTLITTMPLDITLELLGRREWAQGLQHCSTHIIGIGIRGTCPHGSKCWLYFPEDTCPFYRATVFSNYAEDNCPPPSMQLPTLCLGDGSDPPTAQACAGPYWSLMLEVTEGRCRPVDPSVTQLGGTAGTWPVVVRDALFGAIATQLMQQDDQVVSLFHRRLEHGYPIPSLSRNAVLDKALPWLKQHGIYSRGRFGSYKYEVGNQDHSLMLGVEAVDNILFGCKELTLSHPDIVNAFKNTELQYNPIQQGIRNELQA
eukprot:gene11365-11514_t